MQIGKISKHKLAFDFPIFISELYFLSFVKFYVFINHAGSYVNHHDSNWFLNLFVRNDIRKFTSSQTPTNCFFFGAFVLETGYLFKLSEHIYTIFPSKYIIFSYLFPELAYISSHTHFYSFKYHSKLVLWIMIMDISKCYFHTKADIKCI